MAAPVRKDPPSRQASAVRRGAPSSGAAAYGVRRPSVPGGNSGSAWVVVEPEADIAAKGHPYISFDPAGSF